MKIPILMYHEVAIESEFTALSRYINRKYIIKKSGFKAQLDLIRSGIYETLTISELRNTQDNISKAIALTFDDGHAGNFNHAFELLKEFNAKATFFVTTNLIGLQNMLSWEQIKEMSREGMEIGSHTCSHLLLVNASENKVKEELQKSKDTIENRIKKQVRSLSFPNGSYNLFVNRIAKDCGYENACTSDFGYWNPSSHDFTLPRITAPEEITMFERIINQNQTTILKRNAIEYGKRALKGIIGSRLYNSLYMRLFNLREMGGNEHTFLSSKSPYPLKDGHSLRTFNILKQVSKNNRIFFLTYFLEKSEEECFEQVSQLCAFAKGLRLPISEAKSILAAALIRNIFSPFPFVAQKYRTFAMQREIERILKEERIDVVHVDILPLMINYPLFKHLPVVLVEHNVESLLLKRRVKYARNLISKIFWWMQALKLSRFEKRQLGAASLCAAVSQEEKKLIGQLNRKAKTEVVPNGVDTKYFFPDGAPKEENTLIFVGGLNWFPNNDGMNYFCEEIYQKISANLNNLQVFVAGKEDRSFRYGNLVKQLGFVSDIRPHVRDAKVFIVPLRIGGGSRLKILDAMAMGKAIVSTSIGCEGLEVKNGIHLLIEDTPSGFARAVIELCLNAEKREFLAKNARKLVEEKYDWETIGKKMNQVYEKVLAN